MTTVKTKLTALAFTLIWLLYCAAIPFRDLSSKCGDSDERKINRLRLKGEEKLLIRMTESVELENIRIKCIVL